MRHGHSPQSTQFIRHPFNLNHIVVPDWSHLTVIPRNNDSIPSRTDNSTKIGGRFVPTNPVADDECSGLAADHGFNPVFADAAS
jgi:hypothetical protein